MKSHQNVGAVCIHYLSALFANRVSCHNSPLPGLLVHALPVLNHGQSDHNANSME